MNENQTKIRRELKSILAQEAIWMPCFVTEVVWTEE